MFYCAESAEALCIPLLACGSGGQGARIRSGGGALPRANERGATAARQAREPTALMGH